MKVTNPGVKKIIRFHNGNDRMIGDLLAQVDEPLPSGEFVKAHHPTYDYMKKMYRPPYTATDLMVPIFLNGRQVYEPPGLDKIRARAESQINSLEPEYKRFTNPHIYKVSLSDRSYQIKKRLLDYYEERAHFSKK
jgi:nicotinate phosphoribosyltransferase